MTATGTANNVRERPDWYLGLIVRGEHLWTVPVARHQDHAGFEFKMPPPVSFGEVHQAARDAIEEFELLAAVKETQAELLRVTNEAQAARDAAMRAADGVGVSQSRIAVAADLSQPAVGKILRKYR